MINLKRAILHRERKLIRERKLTRDRQFTRDCQFTHDRKLCVASGLLLLFLITLTACFSPYKSDEAAITIYFAAGRAADAPYPPDAETLSRLTHTAELSGPTGTETHTLETGVTEAHFQLAPGTWAVSVRALLDGVLYAEGSGSAEVRSGETVDLMIEMAKAAVSVSGGGGYAAVTDIINLPVIALVDSPLTLSGTVVPENAANKTIVWSGNGVVDGVFKATTPGRYTLTATIANGASESSPYVKNFTVTAFNDETNIYIAEAQGTWTKTLTDADGIPFTLTFIIDGTSWEFIDSDYGGFIRGIIISATADRYEAQVTEELRGDGEWVSYYSYVTGSYSITEDANNVRTITLTPDDTFSDDISAGAWTEVLPH